MAGDLLGVLDLAFDRHPTGPGYCANCGRTPCMHLWLETDPHPKHPEWTCASFSWPRPFTEFNAVIDGLRELEAWFPGMDRNEIGLMIGRIFSDCPDPRSHC